MKFFLFPLIIGLIAVAGLNFYVDTNNTWWRTEFNFTKNWNKNQAWVTPIRIDERKPRIKQIGMLPKIDLLGIGSSRFYTVDSYMFPASTAFYNASVSGATMWDFVAIWERFKQQNNIPKHLIIYVDTWGFNKNTWQKYRWIPNLPLVLDFLNDNDKSLKTTALSDYFSGSFYEFSDLFSPAVLKVSFEELNIQRKKGKIKTNFISDIESRPLDFPAWASDGSRLYPPDDLKPKSLEEINAMGRNTGLGSMSVYMTDWETDTNAIKLLNYLLADAEKYGVDVLLVQPPFQQEAFKVLTTSPEYKEIPSRYATIMQSVLNSHKNTTYCNALDPQIVACLPTEFMDSAHTLKPCSKKIINYCLAKVPQWYKKK